MAKPIFDFDMETYMIEFFRSNPCLWNPSDRDYYHKQKRQNCLKELQETFRSTYCKDISIESIKKKWKNLQSSLKREHKALKKASDSAGSKKRKWVHYDSLTFLIDPMEPDESTNARAFQEHEITNVRVFRDHESTNVRVFRDHESTNARVSQDDEDNTISVHSAEDGEASFTDSVVDNGPDNLNIAFTSLETAHNALMKHMSGRKTDRVDDFFEYIAKTVKILPLKKQQIVLQQINNIVTTEILNKDE